MDAQRYAADLREFDGIIQQVDQDLPQFDSIGANVMRHVGGALTYQAHIFLLRSHGEHALKLVKHAAQINVAFIQRDAPGLDFRQIQHLIDERQQMLAAALNNRQTLPRLRRQIRRMRQQLGKAENRVERGAEFVAHIGEKRAFGVIGGIGLARGFLQLRVRGGQIAGALIHKGFEFLLPRVEAAHAIRIPGG